MLPRNELSLRLRAHEHDTSTRSKYRSMWSPIVRSQGKREIRSSIRRSRLSTVGYLRAHGSRYDGGTAMPIPVQERKRKYGANILLIARRVGYCTFTLKPSTFAVAIPEDLRNALRNWPWKANQIISARQKRVEKQSRMGAPCSTRAARSRAVCCKSPTQFNPEKFDKAPSNRSERINSCSVGRTSKWMRAFGSSAPIR